MQLVFLDPIEWDYDVATPFERPLGGSQSALCYLAIELARRGHHVSLISNTSRPGLLHGVHCQALRGKVLPSVPENTDAVIVLNGPADLCLPLRSQLPASTLLILWTQHASNQKAMQSLARPEIRSIWSKIVCVSAWHREQMQAAFHIDPERLAVMENAVGPTFERVFTSADELAVAKSSRPVLAYTSTPFRGLDVLLDAFPHCRREFPDAELRVYSSMKVYQQDESADEYKALYQRCRETPGVVHVGSIPQAELKEALRSIPILAYPSTFAETSCIALMEALASGMHVVTSDLGALPETSRGFAELARAAQNVADLPAFRDRYRELLCAAIRRQQADPAGFAAAHWPQVQRFQAENTWAVRARQWEEALAGWQARAVKPVTMSVESALELAERHLQAGRLAEAATVCRLVMHHDPNCAEAYRLLGMAALVDRQPEAAISLFQQAIQRQPMMAGYHDNLGAALQQLRRFPEAEQAARQALLLQSDLAEAHYNLGRCLEAQDRLDEAVASYRRALELRPNLAQAANNLGNILLRRRRYPEALAVIQQGLAVEPNDVKLLNSLARVLQDTGSLAEAEQALRQALAVRPNMPEVLVNLATVVEVLGRLGEAEQCCRQAMALQPDLHAAGNNLSMVLLTMGRADEALAEIRRVLAHSPGFVAAHNNLLLEMQYDPAVTPAELLEAHREFETRHAAPLRARWPVHANTPDPERPLRIGFLSGDLGEHPVGYFLVRFLEALDLRHFQAHCYSARQRHDPIKVRLESASAVWREVGGRSDDEMADTILADQVDILFELAGHTSGNLLAVFARKPAPIQLTWSGYVGTTGLAAIDYLLADRFHVPPGEEQYYQEQVLRLPDGYICYDPPDYAPAVGPLPATVTGSVTFGSFNNPAKINRSVVKLWADLLQRVPGSRLVLHYLGLTDPVVTKYYQELFRQVGIESKRLVLHGWSPRREVLAHYNEIDLALDTFPYSGGLTTCEALWMGVPVLTWPGRTFAGRHSLSHLSNAGLTETIARSPEEYVEIAAGLARDLPRLARLRAELRPRMASSPLCDGPRFARNLEAALREVWRRWCAARAGA